MDESTEGETEEHLQLMNLLMRQSDEPAEQNDGSGADDVTNASGASTICNTSNSFGLVTQTGSCVQPGKSLLFMSEEINRQMLKEELPLFPDSSEVARLMDSLPTNGQVPHLEQQLFSSSQIFDSLSANNVLPPYGLLNFDANDSEDFDDPSLSAVGLDYFESSDMIASSEKDLDQFNKIFQGELTKPKKEKKEKTPKDKTAAPKKQPALKKLVTKEKPKKVLSEDKVPTWAKAYLDLFRSQQPNFEMEKQFNERNSLKYPFCSVCSLLQPRVVINETGSAKVVDETKTSSTPPKSTPDVLAIYKGRLNAAKPKTDGSALLQCVSCKVCVHAFCYGEAERNGEWKCSRCKMGDFNATCCLCNLRGGTLALTTKHRWCHIVCALINTDINFTDSIRTGGIDISNIPKIRKTMKCGYCTNFQAAPDVTGGVVQCTTAKCRFPFHVTCGHAAGVVFQPDTKHFPVFVMCHKHLESSKQKRKGTKRPLAELQVGDKVIAQHKNNRYYTCEIIEVKQDLFCKAAFEDGSLSSNLYPEDFQGLNIRQDGPPALESTVKVLWRPDGDYYTAIFKGTLYVPYYVVRFHDGSTVDVNSDDIYTLTEKLPMKVRSKLSEVTLVPQTADESPGRRSSGEEKRSRQPNPLYFGRSYVKK